MRQGEHLLALINEVLDLSRIEAGKHELAEEAIDLASTVEACCHMLELRALPIAAEAAQRLHGRHARP